MKITTLIEKLTNVVNSMPNGENAEVTIFNDEFCDILPVTQIGIIRGRKGRIIVELYTDPIEE